MSKSLFVPVVFVGLSLGLAVSSALAAEPCRIVSPRYEPKSAKSHALDVRLLGGARLSRPVAAPCPHPPRPVDA